MCSDEVHKLLFVKMFMLLSDETLTDDHRLCLHALRIPVNVNNPVTETFRITCLHG